MIRRTVILSGALAMLSGGASAPANALTCTPGPYIVLFTTDFAYLDREARGILDNLVQNIGECGYGRTLLAGHIDTSEEPSLGLKRAKVVQAFLIAHGTPEEDIDIVNQGATMPRIQTGPNVFEKQNRRVEIKFGSVEFRNLPNR